MRDHIVEMALELPEGLLGLPEDVQWYIWNLYGKNHVMSELINKFEFIWHKPSYRLMTLVSCDQGAIQHGHHELADMIDDDDMWAYNICVHGRCENCAHYGFPCTNSAVYGFRNPYLVCLFHANF